LLMTMPRLRRRRPESADKLEAWLADGYAQAYRTAFLILHDHHDAEEVVQEAFLRAWRFRSAVPDGDGVRPWMYRVVVNCCLSRLRADKSRTRVGAGLDGPMVASGYADPADRVDMDETRRLVLAAVSSLPDHLRVVVVLRYYAHLGEKDIAAVIGRRPGTVKSRVHEAKARLGDDPRLAEFRPALIAMAQEASDD
jgi:RNA polymerase sigma factor (sigma-70 family)